MIRSYQALLNRILILLDSLTLAIALAVAWWIKIESGWLDAIDLVGGQRYFLMGLVMVPLFVLTNAIFGLYSSQRTKRLRQVFFQIAKSSLVTLLIVMSILFFFKEIHFSRAILAMFMAFSFVLLTLERIGMRILLRRLRYKGYNKKFMLVAGAGPLGRKILRTMDAHREFGFHVIGFLDDKLYPNMQSVDDIALLGTLDDLEKILNEHLIDQVVLALPLDAHHRMGDCIAVCENLGVQVLIIPDYFHFLPAKPRFEEVGGLPMIDVRHVPLDNAMNAVLKRGFDIAFSLCVLLVLLPLLALIAIGIKLTSPGPVIFVQERVGKNRRHFSMFKFRTMRVSSDRESNTQWTKVNDSRKTKFGAYLRKTSLDELPQFFNVLKGDMSIVGPRPERPYFVDQFKESIPKYMVKHRVRPGITGWAQVQGWRGDTSIEERIKCDIDYIENWRFTMDLKIVWKTILNGFINKNAY